MGDFYIFFRGFVVINQTISLNIKSTLKNSGVMKNKNRSDVWISFLNNPLKDGYRFYIYIVQHKKNRFTSSMFKILFLYVVVRFKLLEMTNSNDKCLLLQLCMVYLTFYEVIFNIRRIFIPKKYFYNECIILQEIPSDFDWLVLSY